MKRQLFILMAFCLTLITVQAGNVSRIHENVRETPYPQHGHTLYINPTPLLVPQSTRQSDYLQFNLPEAKTFRMQALFYPNPNPGACSILIRYWKTVHGIGACAL